MKKSKCDGASPCSRCQTDNTICVFGERKKTHDKKYPHGYTEMLEQQQAQLVACVREMYRLLQNGEGCPGEPLKMAHHGQPLTHDILERLNLFEVKGEGGSTHDGFEDDLSVLECRALKVEAPAPKRSQRQESVSSDSDHEHHSPPSSYGSPKSRTPSYRKSFAQARAPPTPPSTTPLHHVEMNAPFKIEHHVPFVAPDYGVNYYLDQLQMGNPSGYPANYEQFASVDSSFQFADLAINPSLVMPSWNDFPTVDFMDVATN